jgi:hydrogenase maturation protease
MSSRRTVVAGVGNVFLGDDGFGVEVVRYLAGTPLPDGTELLDVGVRAVHLAYELMAGCDLLILVDASARGQPPGTVSVLDVEGVDAVATAPPVLDVHGLAPDGVLALVRQLGAAPGRTLVVACEPADLAPGMGLSAPVRAAVPAAARLVATIAGG